MYVVNLSTQIIRPSRTKPMTGHDTTPGPFDSSYAVRLSTVMNVYPGKDAKLLSARHIRVEAEASVLYVDHPAPTTDRLATVHKVTSLAMEAFNLIFK